MHFIFLRIVFLQVEAAQEKLQLASSMNQSTCWTPHLKINPSLHHFAQNHKRGQKHRKRLVVFASLFEPQLPEHVKEHNDFV